MTRISFGGSFNSPIMYSMGIMQPQIKSRLLRFFIYYGLLILPNTSLYFIYEDSAKFPNRDFWTRCTLLFIILLFLIILETVVHNVIKELAGYVRAKENGTWGFKDFPNSQIENLFQISEDSEKISFNRRQLELKDSLSNPYWVVFSMICGVILSIVNYWNIQSTNSYPVVINFNRINLALVIFAFDVIFLAMISCVGFSCLFVLFRFLRWFVNNFNENIEPFRDKNSKEVSYLTDLLTFRLRAKPNIINRIISKFKKNQNVNDIPKDETIITKQSLFNLHKGSSNLITSNLLWVSFVITILIGSIAYSIVYFSSIGIDDLHRNAMAVTVIVLFIPILVSYFDIGLYVTDKLTMWSLTVMLSDAILSFVWLYYDMRIAVVLMFAMLFIIVEFNVHLFTYSQRPVSRLIINEKSKAKAIVENFQPSDVMKDSSSLKNLQSYSVYLEFQGYEELDENPFQFKQLLTVITGSTLFLSITVFRIAFGLFNDFL